MIVTVQKQLQFVDKRVLEAHDGVTLFPISRNTPTQEKNTPEIHSTNTGYATCERGLIMLVY